MNQDIKAVFLDVDGVVVGSKPGFNLPSPHPEVIAALNKIKQTGVIVSLCTGRPYLGVKSIVSQAKLGGVHVTDNGAVIIDVGKNDFVEKHVIDPILAAQVVTDYIKQGAYIEIYTTDDYYIQQDSVCDFTENHGKILQRKSTPVKSLADIITEQEVVKIMPIAKGDAEKREFDEVFITYANKLHLGWGTQPLYPQMQFGAITCQNISKQSGAKAMAKYLEIPLENTLGIGDGMSDWDFVKDCGYKATLADASPEVIKHVNSEPTDKSFVGSSTAENGILDIFRHYQLIN